MFYKYSLLLLVTRVKLSECNVLKSRAGVFAPVRNGCHQVAPLTLRPDTGPVRFGDNSIVTYRLGFLVVPGLEEVNPLSLGTV